MSTTTAVKTAPTKVITGKCRLSYANVWEPREAKDGKPGKYGACIVISKKDTKTLDKIKRAVDAAIENGKGKWGGKVPKNISLPLRDGDEEREDDPVFRDAYFINANKHRKPGIVDRDLNPILDKDEVYSGCYCMFSLDFYPYDVEGKKGIAASLENILKVADGDRLAGGASAEEDFANVEIEEDDDLM